MNTVCADALATNLLAFPPDWDASISGTAYVLNQQVKELIQSATQTITVGHHYAETRRMIADIFASAAAPDWDGYGAKPVDLDSCLKAIQFSKLLPMDVPTPDVSVDTDGEVTFDWSKGPRQVLSIAVGANGRLAYAGLFGTSKADGVEYLGDDLPNTIMNNIRRVYA